MEIHTENAERIAIRELCAAPSCWRDGSRVKIENNRHEAVILCRRHRKQYLGVSS